MSWARLAGGNGCQGMGQVSGDHTSWSSPKQRLSPSDHSVRLIQANMPGVACSASRERQWPSTSRVRPAWSVASIPHPGRVARGVSLQDLARSCGEVLLLSIAHEEAHDHALDAVDLHRARQERVCFARDAVAVARPRPAQIVTWPPGAVAASRSRRWGSLRFPGGPCPARGKVGRGAHAPASRSVHGEGRVRCNANRRRCDRRLRR